MSPGGLTTAVTRSRFSTYEYRCEKFIVANLATAAAAHSSCQDGGNMIAEELPTWSVLDPPIGRTRG